MGFRLKQAVAVAAGTFNIYIVQPQWLCEMGLLDQEAGLIETDLRRPGFRFSTRSKRGRWSIRPDRLTVDSELPSEDCGADLATVLETLKWTPLLGVGANLEFTADLDVLSKLAVPLPETLVESGFSVSQRVVQFGISRAPQMFNLKLSAATDSPKDQAALNLVINVHTDVANMSQEAANELSVRACRDFRMLCRESVSLAERVFGVGINYE